MSAALLGDQIGGVHDAQRAEAAVGMKVLSCNTTLTRHGSGSRQTKVQAVELKQKLEPVLALCSEERPRPPLKRQRFLG